MALQRESNTNAITTAGTFVPFATAFPDTNYNVFKNCYNTFGDVGVTITKATTGFTAVPVENATIEWEAVAYGTEVGVIIPTGRLSRDWTAGLFWANMVRDLQADKIKLHHFEKFDLIDRACQVVAAQIYGLVANLYLTEQTVSVVNDRISLAALRIMGLGQQVKLELEANVQTSIEQTAISPNKEEAKSKSLVSGANAITFDQAMTTTDYIILPVCYNAASDAVGYIISAKTASGFTVTVAETATFDYIAREVGTNITSLLTAQRRYVAPVSFAEYTSWRSSSVYNRARIIYTPVGDYLLLKKGDAIPSYTSDVVLRYPRVPIKPLGDTVLLDLPDGIPIELALIAGKSRLIERYGLPKQDLTGIATEQMQAAFQAYGASLKHEEAEKKAKAIL